MSKIIERRTFLQTRTLYTLLMAPLIAIVEDDTALSEMYRFKFERSGFRVETAQNGREGLDLAKKAKPDLILLDLRMPIMSGDEMLAQMRATDWGNDIRVIILTNISKSEAPMGLRFLHVDRYIVKAHHTPSQVIDIAKDVLGIKTVRS